MLKNPVKSLLMASALFVLSGCAKQEGPRFAEPPVLSPNGNQGAPLVAILTAQTTQPVLLNVDISDGERSWSVPTGEVPATDHEVVLLGFRAAREHAVVASVIAPDGAVVDAATLKFVTPALPDYFPAISVPVSKPEQMEPGVTLFALMRWPDGGDTDEEFGLAVAVDETGEVVWYRRDDPMFEDPHRLANGNLISIVGYNRLEESDMIGNVVATWHADQHPNAEAVEHVPEGSIAVATETFHHDVQEMPSGNLLTLSTELRVYPEYPASIEDPATTGAANVIGDVIIEFARDGSTVNEWRLLDMLDPLRLGYESLGEIWDIWAYGDVEGGTRDWSHANSVFYDEAADSILVSLRHQEAVISFSRATGELNWILGAHDSWGPRWQPFLLEPVGELQWQYHQHAAEVTPSGTIIIFDNGNFRALPPAQAMTGAEAYSRAVEYLIDAEAKTVEQVWSYGAPGEGAFFSPFISEADRLPVTGNVLITDGGRVEDESGAQTDQIVGGNHWARIVEVTRSEDPEVVFELVVDSSDHEPDLGWAVYRSDRLPSLYANRLP